MVVCISSVRFSLVSTTVAIPGYVEGFDGYAEDLYDETGLDEGILSSNNE